MGKYIVKRILLAILTVVIISIITFAAMNAVPGGPFNKEKASNPTVIAAMEARYNLDKPVTQQYFMYMKNILKGDFGVSLNNGREITAIFKESFPISAKLGLSAAILAIIVGIVLGSIAALMRNKWPDRVIVFFITLITAMPSFVVATLLLYFFCLKLGLVQAFSAGTNQFALPVIALSMSPMAYITRLTKTSMLDALGQDYIRTAKAKGVPQLKVIFVHGLRNALIPVITYVGPMIAGILTGSMVVESIFNIGGLGAKFVSSINDRDYTLIMATTIFLATVMVIANLITDIVYKIVDPRIKLD
jgi:oligopeptide transport system permease protein